MGGLGLERRAALCALLASALAFVGTGAARAESPAAWTQRALALQYSLASDVPLRNTPWVYTHNSFNSKAEMGPTLSDTDQNQQISITDQLDHGVRHLEIDTHWFHNQAVVCHALDNHFGCTIEKSLVTVLGEVRAWLRAHPSQVLLLYLESHLDDTTGYGAGAAAIQQTLGGLVVRPPGGGSKCAPLPLSLTRDEIRKKGKQVLIFGPCGVGNEWQSWVFDETHRETGHTNASFRPFPDCGPDFKRPEYDAYPIRYYEDSTKLTQTTNAGETDPITAPIATAMIRCGVDIIGFDQLLPDDSRLTAEVWSWAAGEPRGGGCALQRSDGRWVASPCEERHRVACRDRLGSWEVPKTSVPAAAAPRACGSWRLRSSVPRTGYEGQLLRVAQQHAGAGAVWLGYRSSGGTWSRYERAGCGPGRAKPRHRWLVHRGVARFAVRLRFACTRERLYRRVVVRGGKRVVRGRTFAVLRVPVRRHTRRLRVSYRYGGRRHTLLVLLRRR